MTPTGEVDLHSDSGSRRLSGDGDDEVEGYGIRGACLLRRVEARILVRLSSIRSMRAASRTACRFAQVIHQQKHGQQPTTWRTAIPR
eukprot:9494501-Pyramimonas_sp.AAC.1